MASTNDGRQQPRLRPTHFVLATVALLALAACSNALVRSESETFDQSLVALDLAAPVALKSSAFVGDGAAGPMARPADPASFAGDDALAERDRSEAQGANAGDDALIVRTASLELEVENVATVLLDARSEMIALGGYVAGSDEYDQGDRRWASVTYRVPVERFIEALDALRGLSDRVVRESTQSQEVTATVVDLDARISNLRASEEALVEIMDRSGRIEDVLQVQLQLQEVRGQIERLEAQRGNLADQAVLSTLTVTWFTPVAAVTVAQEGWSLATEVDRALAQTVEALQGVASLGVWIAVVAVPLLALPVMLLLVLYRLIRRRIGDRGDHGPAGSDGSAAVSPTPAE